MKRLFIMICILLICIALSGCDDGRKAERRDSYGVNPIMTIYGKDTEEKYFYYAVDERTGVVYIMGVGYHQGYMSPALNADGTPMLKDQLKEMMQEKE